MQTLCLFTALSCVVLGRGMAQQIWTVNCQGGYEAHFTDLPKAVAAAAPGDEIRVYGDVNLPTCPGLINFYTAPIIDKPIRIVGFRVGTGVGSIPGINLRGGILIVGLAAGEQVVLSNLSISPLPSVGSPSGIVALNCQGSILIEDCFVNAGVYQYLRFENCANVTLRGSDVLLLGFPVEVINSTLLMTTCTVHHSPILFGPPFYFGENAPGLRVADSIVTLTESIVDGSDAYNVWPQSSFIARPGIVIDSGTVRIGPGALVRGGLRLSGGYAPGFQPTGPNATVELDSRGTIFPLIYPPTIPTEIHAAAHNWITAGEAYEVLVAGPLGGFAVLAVGDWLPAGVPTPFGSLQIDPQTIQVDSIVPLSPTDGRYFWPLTCPATVPVAHAFAFQAAVLSQQGVISLTVPSPFAVGWGATALP